jgi:hypothetical protein
MKLKEHLWLPFCGFLAGAANGLLGAGGGMLLVPMLTKSDSLTDKEVFGTLLKAFCSITVIENCYNAFGKIKVELDTVRNPGVKHGCFYFQPYELEVVNETNDDILEENTMNNNNKNDITNYLNTVKVKFVDDNKFSSNKYANFDSTIATGDMVVLNTPYAGLELATVVEIIDSNDVGCTGEVVAKVDTTAYDARVANRAKAAELKAKMKERAKQLQDIALYQMLAKDDPAMLELLSEYQAIPGM